MEPTQTQQLDPKVEQYILGFIPPAEAYFFTSKQHNDLAMEQKKLEETQDYVANLLDKPELYDEYKKLVMSGKLYPDATAKEVIKKVRAMEGGGNRYDLSKSIVSPKGEVVILSESACKKLDIDFDTYVLLNDVANLVQILKSEGVTDVSLNALQAGASRYGAVIIQRGGFMALKDSLEEAINYNASQASLAHGASLGALKNRLVTPAVPQPPKPAMPTAPKGPQMTPDEIKREMATKELSGPKLMAQPIVAPKPPTPPPVLRPQPQMPKPNPVPLKPSSLPKLKNNPELGLNSLNDIQVIDDLKLIEPAHLRQGYIDDQVKMIRSKISYLASANRMLPVQVENVFEQSPLFRLYLQMGNELMAATTPDHKPDYEQLANGLLSRGQDVLSFAEFQAVADLRKNLK